VHTASIPAVLLDRDGTLVRGIHYLSDPSGLELLPGVVKGLARLDRAGVRRAVVTNQAGLARGLVSVDQLLEVNAALRTMFAPVELGPVLWCPHHPDHTGLCRCRKPASGLLLDALALLGARPAGSWMIGDRPTDASAALAIGMSAVVVGDAGGDELPPGTLAARTFDAAVELVLAEAAG